LTEHIGSVLPRTLSEARDNARLGVYLAGKVSHTDWRHGIVPLREADGGSLPWSELEIPFEVAGIPLLYTGPFFTSCDHGCGHAVGLHGCGAPGGDCGELSWEEGRKAQHRKEISIREHVRIQCAAAIRRSDLVFAWIDDLTAFGTLWEIGYAAASGKRVRIGYPPDADISELWLSTVGAGVTCADSAKDAIERFIVSYTTAAKLDGLVESPIERTLLNALRRWFGGVDTDRDCFRMGDLMMRPQQHVMGGRYRVDFAVWDKSQPWRIAVECDGHAFHERTKEQAQRDKSRDRDLALEGWTVLRFTGSEIVADALACCSQILDMAAMLSRKELAAE